MQNTMQDMTIQPKQSSLAGKQQCQPLALAAVAPGELPNQEKEIKRKLQKKKNTCTVLASLRSARRSAVCGLQFSVSVIAASSDSALPDSNENCRTETTRQRVSQLGDATA